MGKHTVEELAKRYPHRLIHIYTHKEDISSFEGVPITRVSKQRLSQLAGSDSHQGIVARIRDREYMTPSAFLSDNKKRSLVLMVDSINDPQNFGAILRAAECFQVDVVIYSKNRNVGITPVVSKASVGASEMVPLMPVSNLSNILKKFQDHEYTVFAATLTPESTSLYTCSFPSHTLLIMGSEGKGIQPLLLKQSDQHIQIPMHGVVDSLNVSQACAVCLSAYHHALINN